MENAKLALTVNNLIEIKKKECADKIAFFAENSETWEGISWNRFTDMIKSLASNLYKCGVKKGDRVGILCSTRYEWEVAEKALFSIGAVIVGIDVKFSNKEISKVINDLSIVAVIAENESYKKLPSKFLKTCKVIVIVENFEFIKKQKSVNIKDFYKKQKFAAVNVVAEDPAVIIYTSGTTGEPKAIMYRHKHLALAYKAISDIFKEFEVENETTICWLPMQHMTSKIINLVCYNLNIPIYFVNDPHKIVDKIKDINPTFFLGVPRFYEKIYQAINGKFEEKPFYVRFLVKSSLICRNLLRIKLMEKIFDFLIVSKIKNAIFGKRINFMMSGTAPIDNSILKFFHSIGFLVLEVYATSEVAIPIAMNTPINYKFGTVGIPTKYNEISFAEDGEILVKGESVFDGYLNHDNKDIFDKNGRFKTGDLGYLDKDGFLILTGRKKELIKTSTGIRISPIEVEGVYGKSKYIDYIVVIGNNRKFLSALITPNKDAIKKWHSKRFHKEKDIDLSKMPEVAELISQELDNRNHELAEFKQIKKFKILNNSFTPETGELTNSLKLKRSFIESKYIDEIERMYAEK